MNYKKPLSILLLLCSIFTSNQLKAGSTDKIYKFWVEFKDKTGTPYSLLKPWDFLSDKALARRRKAGYFVNMDDLPVNPEYVKNVIACGGKFLLSSRWMNAVLIETKDSFLVKKLKEETYVKNVTLMGYWSRTRGAAALDPDAFKEFNTLDENNFGRISVKNKAGDSPYNFGYGLGWDQLCMLKAQALHNNGFKGKGVIIAVLDAGFYRVNLMAAFDSLKENKQILATRDFVDFDASVYNDDDHGTQVLSCMAANVPGIMVGTAPEASYLLLRTEDANSEFPSEEAQWLAAAEYADSMGADIINSSLGYTNFDRPEFGHHFSDMNGHTALITLAANMAWDRGIVVVNAAGNEGDEKWEKMGAPADAVGVLAIAAVDINGQRAGFSSLGPTYDGRIKPDLAALGKRAIVGGTSGYFYGSNGTSFSAPILTGAIACFIQSHYNFSPAVVRNIVCMSASNYLEQDTMLGHGIPDFAVAMRIAADNSTRVVSENPFFSWPEPDTLNSNFEIKTTIAPSSKYYYKLTDEKGRSISSGTLFKQEDILYAARIRMKLAGTYNLVVWDNDKKWKKKFYFKPIIQND